MMDKFAYFIPSYNKADNIPTLNLLRQYNTCYPIYIVVGDDDPQLTAYQSRDDINLLIFSKSDYYSVVDSVGTYSVSHKVCTYARAFIDDYAMSNDIRYVCFMFDDIQSLQLRYIRPDYKVGSTKVFKLDQLMSAFVEFLSCSDHIGIVGPPSSSYYIGVNKNTPSRLASHYGNMFIYDITRPIGPYKASVLEDMTIVLYNNLRGNLCVCPFGLQVNCREPMVTEDAYVGINRSEYIQQHVILTNGAPMDMNKLSIPYKNFTPKILSGVYKK